MILKFPSHQIFTKIRLENWSIKIKECCVKEYIMSKMRIDEPKTLIILYIMKIVTKYNYLYFAIN